MLRNLLGWVCLAPMLLNGLWVVCDDVPSKAAAAPVSQELSEEAANCAKMCPMGHQMNAGEMCLILPGDSKKSITMVDFGVAILTPEVQFQPLAGLEGFVAELPVFHSNPSLSNHTPPPKA